MNKTTNNDKIMKWDAPNSSVWGIKVWSSEWTDRVNVVSQQAILETSSAGCENM